MQGRKSQFGKSGKRKDRASQSPEELLTVEREKSGVGKMAEAVVKDEQSDVLPEYFFEKVNVMYVVKWRT